MMKSNDSINKKPLAKRKHGWRKMRALTSHPYGPGSIPEPVVT